MGLYFDLRERLRSALEGFVHPRVADRLALIPNKLNEYGYDPWGLDPATARYTFSAAYWWYENYFRAEVSGIEQVPQGRVLLIANHSGQLPVDGMLLMVSMLMEADPPRVVRGMVERWGQQLPFITPLFVKSGQVLGDPQNAVNLLENDEALMVFPEGVRGSGKTWWHRYELMEFGLGFMRLALRTRTPIVPVGIVGGEEQCISLYDAQPVAKLIGAPYFPITPLTPVLGPLSILPLPTKQRLYFDEPLYFEGDPDEEDREIEKKVEVVKSKIMRLLTYGLEQREHVFW